MALQQRVGVAGQTGRLAAALGGFGLLFGFGGVHEAGDGLGRKGRQVQLGRRGVGRSGVEALQHGAHVGRVQDLGRRGDALQQGVAIGAAAEGELFPETRREAQRAGHIGGARLQPVGVGACILAVHDEPRGAGGADGPRHGLQAARRHDAQTEVAGSAAREVHGVFHLEIEHGHQAIGADAGHPGAAVAALRRQLRHDAAAPGHRLHPQRLNLGEEQMVESLVYVRQRARAHDFACRFPIRPEFFPIRP
ncbi:MAG: hypothetical protein ACLUVF_07095 [Adlercreutzia sp.]